MSNDWIGLRNYRKVTREDLFRTLPSDLGNDGELEVTSPEFRHLHSRSPDMIMIDPYSTTNVVWG